MISINGWRVSVSHVTSTLVREGQTFQGDIHYTLKVFRFPKGLGHPKEECPECYDRRFVTQDEAYHYAKEHGHLQ